MTNQTLLAAVRAAASEPAPIVGAAQTSQPKESPMADAKDGATAPAKTATATAATPTTAADLAAAFPDLVAAIRADAAQAERERIAAIEALDAMGHADVIARCKADGKSTAADAALAINHAEKAARAAQLTGVKGVEAHTGTVAAAPTTDAGAGHAAAPAATTPDGWKAEYAGSAKLQSEFASAEDYVAYKANESKVRILGRKSA